MLLAHGRDGLDRILEHTNAETFRFDASRLVQGAVIRNSQTMAEPSQRLSAAHVMALRPGRRRGGLLQPAR